MAGSASRVWFGLIALLACCACAGSAQAGVEACYALQSQFSPNDVALATQFVSEHGECLADFGDPAFQSVAAALTGLTASGALQPGQCRAILDNQNTAAAKQLLALADGGVVSGYLDCGCAVAESGVAKKLKEIAEDVVSCAKTFDPSEQIMSGLAEAGETLGLSTLWGLAGQDHDPRAGVGNAGAPTEAYDVPMCGATGVPINGLAKAWDGTWLSPGQHVVSCHCPSPTVAWADMQFVGETKLFHSPTFSCMACGPGTAKNAYGNCAVCENKSGPDGFEYWNPNKDGSACVMTHVAKNCQAGWISNGDECSPCPPDTYQSGSACVACPASSHSPYGSNVCAADACPAGMGLPPGGGECGVCPPDTQLKQGGICEACKGEAHSAGGDDFCKIENYGFGGVSCPAGTVHPPGDAVSCVCAPGTTLVNGVCQPTPKLQLRQVLQPTNKQQ